MSTRSGEKILATGFFLAVSATAPAHGEEQGNSDVDLAKKLANPIASLVSVPFQFNYDNGYGPVHGDRAFVNVQPVIPVELSLDLSLVTRTILPIALQNDIAGRSGTQFGLGDTLQSFFLVPKSQQTALGTLTYGGGPAVNWPTSTDRLLGSDTLGMGPTGVFLFQESGWTYGALVNHVWGVADTRDHTPDLNNTFFQPFLSYTTSDAWTFAVNTESSYNWAARQWSVPINWTVAKLTAINDQRVQFTAGLRYWAHSTPGGPDGVGARFAVTFLFPK
jgi:hypothetical protein